MTSVAVNTYTHSVTYLADNILKSLKDIILFSGLDPSAFVDDWETHKRGVHTWMMSSDLETVTLEIYNPRTDVLIFSLGHRHCLWLVGWGRQVLDRYRTAEIRNQKGRTGPERGPLPLPSLHEERPARRGGLEQRDRPLDGRNVAPEPRHHR